MNLKRCFQPLPQTCCASTGLLILRLIAGCAFLLHGWGKIQTPMNWMPPDAAVPGFLQLLAAVAEFGGGIAWIIGLLTPLASSGLVITMSVAVATHALMLKDPFVNLTGGRSFEPALVYWGVAFVFLLVGPGKFSLDRKFFGDRKP